MLRARPASQQIGGEENSTPLTPADFGLKPASCRIATQNLCIFKMEKLRPAVRDLHRYRTNAARQRPTGFYPLATPHTRVGAPATLSKTGA